jgi:hypothetical protein
MADIRNALPIALWAPTLEATERRQQIMQAAWRKMDGQRFTEADEGFWTEFRAAMLDAGATETDIRAVAAHFACFWSAAASGEKLIELLELITERFACTDMTLRIRRTDGAVSVEFPGCEAIH